MIWELYSVYIVDPEWQYVLISNCINNCVGV
jgi:hypothetical protein